MNQGDHLLPAGFKGDWNSLEEDWRSGSENLALSSATNPTPTALITKTLPRAYETFTEFLTGAGQYENIGIANPTDPAFLDTSLICNWDMIENEFSQVDQYSHSVPLHKSAIPLVEKYDMSTWTPTLPPVSPALEFPPNETTVTSGWQKKRTKQRLPCAYTGCKLTFPRPYELKRHVQNIHERNVNVPCPVYGCNRISKPFARWDKFTEHFRKHGTPDSFLCLVEGCTLGPFSLTLLASHLLSHHQHEHSQVPNLYKTMQIISPFTLGGQILFTIAKKRQEGKDTCPMKSLGCTFRLSVTEHDMLRHVHTHDMIDRATSYDEIVEYPNYGNHLENGLVNCPACKWGAEGCGSLAKFTEHFKVHSKQERQRHATKLFQMFHPFLSGIARLPFSPSYSLVAHQTFLEILVELQEVYVILPNGDKVAQIESDQPTI